MITRKTDNDRKAPTVPPKWADMFLQWYCRPELLDEIQGDAYELYYREIKQSKRKADWKFVWNVIRFFRWKNIRKQKQENTHYSTDMLHNIFKVAVRNFFRQPGHSFLNVFGLSVSLMCALLIMLWAAHEVSFDKFHSDSDRIFKVLTHVEADGSFQTYDVASSAMDVSSIPEAETLVSVSTGTRWPHELCFRPEGKTNECIYLNGVYANEHLFSVFNFPIMEGDPRPLKGTAEIAISEKMAIALYGTANPIGKTIRIDDTKEVTIVSVFENVPANSSLQFDFVLPYAILQKQWGINDEMMARNFFNMYVKTSSTVSAELLTEKLSDVRVVTEALKNQKVTYQAYPLADWHLKSKFEGGKNTGGKIEYIILFVVVGILVVVMAVINLINMSTARATLRAKEIGIRKVTGALRSTIAAQFMGESFLMVFVSFLLSVLLTQLALPFFSGLIQQPIGFNLFSGMIPIYILAFLLLISFVAGIYPSMVMSSFQPIRILKNQLTSSASGSQGFRKTLLVIQLSVSIVIIVFSGVLYQQLEFITNKNLGFNRSNVIRVEPTFRLLKKFDIFKSELAKNESIVSVGAANQNPLNAVGANTGVTWPGKPEDLRISFRTIGCTYDFPEAMGLKIIEGNNFEMQKVDTVRTEALVSQEAVKLMGLKNPIGEEIKIGQITCVIIGVVNDFHTASLHEALLPAILFRQHIEAVSALYVTYQPGTTKQSLEALTNVYKMFEPDYTMKYWFQDETFDELYKTEIVASRLVLLFTVIALSIAIIGIVGLATFNTLRKTKEIGIRRVFGASVTQALTVLASEFLLVLVLAMLVGMSVAWYAADQWLQSFAYHATMPWWIFGATCVSVVALIIVAICLQAIRTIQTSPTKMLRSE